VGNIVSPLKKAHKLRIFEKMMLRRIFVPKRDRVTRG
jgi:hypothetical protein